MQVKAHEKKKVIGKNSTAKGKNLLEKKKLAL